MCDLPYDVSEWQSHSCALFASAIQSALYVYHVYYLEFSRVHVNLIIHLMCFPLSLEA